MGIKILEKCVGCGNCVVFCPRRAIKTYGVAIVDENKCSNCGICAGYCPINAIKIDASFKS